MNTPPRPSFPQNTSDQHFYRVILLNVVWKDLEIMSFEDDNPLPPQPSGLRLWVMPWGHNKVTIRKRCRRNFKRGSFDWKLRGLVPFLILYSNLRDNPPTPIISPQTSDQHFGIAILFNAVERSVNYVFEDDTLLPPPHSPQDNGYKLCPWGIIENYFYRKHSGRNSKKGSFDCKLKGLVPFLSVLSDQRAKHSSPLANHFPKHFQSNYFEIVILFNVFERFGNTVFEDKKSPQS